jgi:UDP-glucose 4-epimerase
MKKLLVTGALGHIGSRLIRGIRPGQFDQVKLIDNLATQRYPSLFDLPQGIPYDFVEDDVCTADLAPHLDGVDVVIHLAAITNAAGSFDNQAQVEQVNYEGTVRMAEACIQSGSKLVFLSTTSVYGTQEKVVDEDCSMEELQPQSPYADSKLRAERHLERLGRERGLDFVTCRFGTIYGTSIGMRFHTAINKFCWQACAGIPLTVWRTALDQKRPYLDLGDAVAALQFILERRLFDRRIYNVLTDNITVGEIVEQIRTHVPALEVKLVDSRIMNQLSYEVSRARFEKLGFQFRGSLAQGIAETIALIRGMRRQARRVT